ncbi:MAG: RNA polymerase-binding protein DksA [Gammaproteobacteria bacterium]|nr:MAG: RNA polymerase-binding protein DksA [Gammaproteobacteria bacterium]
MSDNSKYRKVNNEKYMSPAMKSYIGKILQDRRNDLMQEVDKTMQHMKHDVGAHPDPNDRATQEEEFSFELRTRDRERKLLNKIELSLISLDSDGFGFCNSCGDEIGIHRLEARPMATMCINCKELEEQREHG